MDGRNRVRRAAAIVAATFPEIWSYSQVKWWIDQGLTYVDYIIGCVIEEVPMSYTAKQQLRLYEQQGKYIHISSANHAWTNDPDAYLDQLVRMNMNPK